MFTQKLLCYEKESTPDDFVVYARLEDGSVAKIWNVREPPEFETYPGAMFEVAVAPTLTHFATFDPYGFMSWVDVDDNMPEEIRKSAELALRESDRRYVLGSLEYTLREVQFALEHREYFPYLDD